jgi:hypothetical protein
VTKRLAAVPFLIALTVAFVADAEPVPSGPIRGASLGLFASEPDYDYAAMLDEMASRGARDVLIVDRWMQRDLRASELGRVDGSSPSLSTLARTLRQARERGLRVGVMPIVGLERRAPGQWRGRLEPQDLDAWFASYERHLRAVARIAQREGASRLVIGSELNALEGHDERWRALATKVRADFDGTLLYSANWDRYDRVTFWDAVDAIGVSAYFRVDGGEPTRVWDARLAEIEVFAAGRDVVLTEVGYPAHAEAARYPWDDTRDAPRALPLQAELLGAFCDAYDRRGGAGYYVWNWFGIGGPRDGGYTLRGKPAAARFERCMEE